jgi:hypothetical protein
MGIGLKSLKDGPECLRFKVQGSKFWELWSQTLNLEGFNARIRS